MKLLSKLRLPYRNDSLYGFLFAIALLVPLAFDVYNYESFEIIKFGLLSLLVGAGIFAFLKKISNSKITLRSSRAFLILLLLFVLWALLAGIFGMDLNYAIFGFYPRFTSGFLFFVLWSVLLVLLSGINREQVLSLLKVLFFTSALASVWGLLQSVGFGYYGGEGVDFFSRAAPSFFGNPNFTAMFIASLIPLGLYFFSFSDKLWSRVYYAASLFIQLWALVVFSSRGGLLALLLGLLVCMVLSLLHFKGEGKKLFISTLVCLIALLSLSFVFLSYVRPGAVAATLSLNETNISNRFAVWNLAYEAIKESPLLGYGPGNFELVFEYNRETGGIYTGFFDDPHNLYLHLAAAGGLPLLLVFLLIVFLPIISKLKSILLKDTQSAVIFSAVGVWLMAAFFTPVTIPCFVLLAFLISALFKDNEKLEIKLPAIVGYAAKFLAGALIVYSLCFIAAEHFFFGSIKAYNARNFKQAYNLSKTAILLNPFNSLYYEYKAGSGIRADFDDQRIEKDLAAFSAFHSNRGYTHILSANLDYLRFYQTGDISFQESILQNLKKAKTLDPFSSDRDFLQAQYESVFGDLKAAELSLKSGLGLNPGNLEARMLLARVYQYQNRRDDFIKTLEEAVKYAGDKTSFLNLLKLAKIAEDIKTVPFKIGVGLGKLD